MGVGVEVLSAYVRLKLDSASKDFPDTCPIGH
jgi:hypothetical protein